MTLKLLKRFQFTSWLQSGMKQFSRRSRYVLLAIATALLCVTPLLANASLTSSPASPASQIAQLPDPLAKGRLLYHQGSFELARQAWAEAEKLYRQKGDAIGVLHSQLNQSHALKALGAYTRALELLKTLNQSVAVQPDSLDKLRILRSLGDAYQAVGELSRARTSLDQSRKLAEKLNLPEELSAVYFSDAIVDQAEIRRTPRQEATVPSLLPLLTRTLTNFQQAATLTSAPTIVVQAQLNRFSLLVSYLPQFHQAIGETIPTGIANQNPNLWRRALAPPLLQLLDPKLLAAPSPSKTPISPSTSPSTTAPTPTPAPLIVVEPLTEEDEKVLTLKEQTLSWTRELLELINPLQVGLESLPLNRSSVDARINYAQSLLQFSRLVETAAETNFRLQTIQQAILKEIEVAQKKQLSRRPIRPTKATKPVVIPPAYLSGQETQDLQTAARISFQEATRMLKAAADQSRKLANPRLEAYALSGLVDLYAQWASRSDDRTRWAAVETLAQKALVLAQGSQAPEITYKVQGQLGRSLLRQGKDIKQARASYRLAVRTLQSLRTDLVAINQDVQFTFRDNVEPIYREAIAALLPTPEEDVASPEVQKNLEEARQLLESLQLAELDNFFREACIQGQAVPLDQVVDRDNPTTAVIYPIIVSKQHLRVIAKIPGQQQLRYEKVDLPAGENLETTLRELRRQLPDRANPFAYRATATTVYNWLVKPFEDGLANSKVDTLVFVLDGDFRNVPMAALYDGKQYLIQQYAIAASPGLQLFDPKFLAQEKLNVLTAGLSEFNQPGLQAQLPAGVRAGFNPLPGVKTELERIQARVPGKLLAEQAFQRQTLQTAIQTTPFNVVHLATHGTFSSRKDQTFILAYDGPINVDQLTEILRSRSQSRDEPIELLVLSACETAGGDNRAALGLAGIAVRAGARSTVGSLWLASDESTPILIDKFYEQLSVARQKNLTKAKALQVAQRALLENPDDPRFRNPFYWAPFILVGNWL